MLCSDNAASLPEYLFLVGKCMFCRSQLLDKEADWLLTLQTMAALRSESGCIQLHMPVAQTQSRGGLHQQHTRGASGTARQQQNVGRLMSGFVMAIQNAGVHLNAHQMSPDSSVQSVNAKAPGTARGACKCCLLLHNAQSAHTCMQMGV